MLSDEELQQKIEDTTIKIDLNEDALVSEEQDIRVGTYHMLTMEHHAMGVYRLLEGNVDAACEAFATAADYQREYLHDVRAHRGEVDIWREVAEPQLIEHGLWFAILSGDEAVRETIAAEAWAIPDAYVERFGRRWLVARAKALAALVTDESRFDEFLDGLEATAHDPFDELLYNAYRGIDDGDAQTVETAVERMLERHDDQVEEPRHWDEIMALGPAAIAVLAREQGLDVSVDSPYLPKVLLEDD